jgi:hypothetical protein
MEAWFYGQLKDAVCSLRQMIFRICQLLYQHPNSQFGICWVTGAPGFNERSIQDYVNFTSLLVFQELDDFAVYYFV